MPEAKSSELKALWVTAFASAAQTVAVIVTLAVAGADYLGKLESEGRAAEDRVSSLYYNQTKAVFEARQLISSLAACRVKFDPYKNLKDSDWSFEPLGGFSRMTYLSMISTCSETESHTDYIYNQPIDGRELVQLVNQVFDCADERNCDLMTAMKLFCADVDLISSAYTDRSYSLVRYEGYKVKCASFESKHPLNR